MNENYSFNSTIGEYHETKNLYILLYPAAYVSRNSSLAWCEDCYISASDNFELSMEDEVGLPFDEYYDIEEMDDCK